MKRKSFDSQSYCATYHCVAKWWSQYILLGFMWQFKFSIFPTFHLAHYRKQDKHIKWCYACLSSPFWVHIFQHSTDWLKGYPCSLHWPTHLVGGPPGSHVHPPRAEPKWYQNDRMNLLFQNRDVPIKTTWTENT